MKRLYTILPIFILLLAQLSFGQTELWDKNTQTEINDSKPKVLLYPNPLVGNDFKVKSTEQPTKIVVINAIGQTVFAEENIDYSFDANYDVNLEQPEKGLYLVRVDYSNKKSVVKKLLVK